MHLNKGFNKIIFPNFTTREQWYTHLKEYIASEKYLCPVLVHQYANYNTIIVEIPINPVIPEFKIVIINIQKEWFDIKWSRNSNLFIKTEESVKSPIEAFEIVIEILEFYINAHIFYE